jgi:hypothetical protein
MSKCCDTINYSQVGEHVIPIPKVKISSTSKTCDMSDIHGSNALNDARNNLKSISMIA